MEDLTTAPPGPHAGGWSSGRVVSLLAGSQGRPAALLVMVVFATAYLWLGERYWQSLHHVVFDAYQQLWPRQETQFPAIIIDIDEASIAAFGQWPWPRTRLAQLIEATHQLGAVAIGLDLIMPEADRLSPTTFLAERRDIPPALYDALVRLPSNDSLLADTIGRVPVVVGRAVTETHKQESVAIDDQTAVRIHGKSPSAPPVQTYPGHLTNLAPLEDAASGHGYLNATLDNDGVIRRMPLVVAIQGEMAPTLAVELLRVAEGAGWYEVYTDPRGLVGIQVGRSAMATDPQGGIRLYFSPSYAARRLSALAVLNGNLPAQTLQGRIALIGATALGLSDVVVTPVAARMDGVEVQVQTIENVRHSVWLVRPWLASWTETLVAVLGAALFIVWLPRVPPVLGIVLWLGLTGCATAASSLAFYTHHVLFDPSFPVLSNAIVLVLLLTAGFALSNRRRHELRAALEVERTERLRVAGELQAARDIQLGMLPAPGRIAGLPPNIEFYALLQPAREVGGDLYDAFMLDEHRFFFLIGDVSGKGVPASLFMALSKTLCKSVALREPHALDALMTSMNQEIARDNPMSLFVTAVAGIIDTRTGAMELSRAGHDAPLVLRLGEAPRSLEAEGGPPLCVLDEFPYTA